MLNLNCFETKSESDPNLGRVSVFVDPWPKAQILSRYAFLTTLVMMVTPLQQPSVHHNPSCDRCVCDAEDYRMLEQNLVNKT